MEDQRIPREFVSTIQTQINIVDVINRYIGLQKKGKSFLGLCPFHNEKTPSFHVDPQKQVFYCFGCHAGGDVIKFLMLIENDSFVSVVEKLASECGLPLPQKNNMSSANEEPSEREEFFRYHDFVATSFQANLKKSSNIEPQPLEYLKKREIANNILEQFRIGYALPDWQGLLKACQLKNEHFVALGQKAGLFLKNDTNRLYDRFRNRIIFPISDVTGRVIAFGGRVINSNDNPKYLNSPETSLFHKSKVLYGIDIAKKHIVKEDKVLIVEGYFDVLSMHSRGYTYTVATCGTSLTKEHLRVLRRYTKNMIILYDSDKAGWNATERSFSLFMQEGIWPFAIELPTGKDPDDVVKEEGALFSKRIETAKPLFNIILNKIVTDTPSSLAGQFDAISKVSSFLQLIESDKQQLCIEYTAQQLGVHQSVIQQQVHQIQGRASKQLLNQQATQSSSVQQHSSNSAVLLSLEESFLLHWLVKDPEELLPIVIESYLSDWLQNSSLKKLIDWSVNMFISKKAITLLEMLNFIEDESIKEKILQLSVTDLILDEESKNKTLYQLILGIKEKSIKQVLSQLDKEILSLRNSKESVDTISIKDLIEKKTILSREYHSLKQQRADYPLLR